MRLDPLEQNWLINYIVADSIPFTHNGFTYSIRSPSRESKVIADEFFFTYYYKSIDEGVLDSDGVYKLLVKYGLWETDKFNEGLLKKLQKEIEDMKVEVFNNYLDGGKRNKIKQAILDTKLYIENMVAQKHSLDHLGAEFVGNYAKYHILLGHSIYKSGKPLWKSMKRWDLADDMSIEVNKKLNKYKIEADQYRELATCDYWRGIYNIRRGNLFGKAIVDWSDHQKQLVSWSQTYENIYKSPDCPTDSIINDNDAIDGWFIIQKRKRDSQLNNSTIESGMSDKIKNSEFIFVLADEENIDKVYGLNDVGGKIALHKRLSQIKRSNIVAEVNMLDTRQILQEKAFELKRGA